MVQLWVRTFGGTARSAACTDQLVSPSASARGWLAHFAQPSSVCAGTPATVRLARPLVASCAAPCRVISGRRVTAWLAGWKVSSGGVASWTDSRTGDQGPSRPSKRPRTR